MAKRKQSRKKSNKAYINTAKSLKRFIPSLKQYTNSRSLTRWQKSAITRAANNFAKAKARHGAALFPLSQRQVKALSPKSRKALIGKGIRAVKFRSTSETATLHVKKGNFVIKEKGKKPRTWQYIALPPEPDILLDKINYLFKRFKKYHIQIHLWLKQGRANAGFSSLKLAILELTNRLQSYANASEFLVGLTYFVGPLKTVKYGR